MAVQRLFPSCRDAQGSLQLGRVASPSTQMELKGQIVCSGLTACLPTERGR